MKSTFSATAINSFILGMLVLVLLLPGIVMVFDSDIRVAGCLMILIWVALLTYKKGAELDLEKGEINFFWSVLGIRSGNIIKLNAFEGYRVISKKSSHTFVSRGGVSSTISQDGLFLDLQQKGSKIFYTVFEGESKEIQKITPVLKEKYGMSLIARPKAR